MLNNVLGTFQLDTGELARLLILSVQKLNHQPTSTSAKPLRAFPVAHRSSLNYYYISHPHHQRVLSLPQNYIWTEDTISNLSLPFQKGKKIRSKQTPHHCPTSLSAFCSLIHMLFEKYNNYFR